MCADLVSEVENVPHAGGFRHTAGITAYRLYVRLGSLAVACVAVLAAGCTLDGDETPPERQVPRPAAAGALPEDRAMAQRVVRYLDRNAQGWPWYRRVERVSVERGVVTIETTVDLDENEDAGQLACSFVQGSDVADFTPGHRIEGRSGTEFECPSRKR